MTLTQLPPFPLTPGLAISAGSHASAIVVTLRGEVDAFTLPLVVDVLTDAIADHDGAVIVDLAQTDFIDLATTRALACASQFLDDHGRTLTIRSPSRAAARLLLLLGLSRLIEPRP